MEAGATRSRMRPWILWSALGILLLAAGVGVALGARGGGKATAKKNKKEDTTAPPAPVELSQVRRGEVATHLQTNTVIEARNSAILVARREGQVIELRAEEGQWVEKGAILARLEDTDARLAVERAELGFRMVRQEAERGQKMREQGFLSAQQWEDLELRQRNAEVTLEQARFDLDRTRLVAPFSGRVVDRSVNLGETVPVGKPCFHLADFNPVLARIYFPERELAHVRVGQTATLTSDALPGESFAARVTLVNPVVDRANGTFKVTLQLANPTGRLRPGAFARVRLETARFKDALLMPRRGLLTEDGEQYVFVARGDSVVRQVVKVGALEEESAQILAGLAPGDQVVTVGHGGLKPGSKIKAVHL